MGRVWYPGVRYPGGVVAKGWGTKGVVIPRWWVQGLGTGVQDHWVRYQRVGCPDGEVFGPQVPLGLVPRVRDPEWVRHQD